MLIHTKTPTIALMCLAVAMAMASCGHNAPQSPNSYNTPTDTTVQADPSGMIWISYKNHAGQTVRDESYLHDTIYDKWIAYSATQNSYNHQGLLDSQTYYMIDIADLTLKPLELDIWMYDSLGRINQAVQKVYGGQPTTWANVKMQMYDYEGSLLKLESEYEWIDEQGRWVETTAKLYDYDSTGKLHQTLIREIDPYDTDNTIKRLEVE